MTTIRDIVGRYRGKPITRDEYIDAFVEPSAYVGEWGEFGPIVSVIPPSGSVMSEQAAMLEVYEQGYVRCRYCRIKSHPVDKFCSGCGAPL